MRNYKIIDIDGKMKDIETLGHVVALDFSPNQPAIDCALHENLYQDVTSDGTTLRGKVANDPVFQFEARQDPDHEKRVQCQIFLAAGPPNQQGSWTAEDEDPWG